MAGNFSSVYFNLDLGENQVEATPSSLANFADQWGISRLIPDRYSDLLVFDLMKLDRLQGISPEMVVREIRSLENVGQSNMKNPTPFRQKPLKGLYHKHFLPNLPSAIAHNILNAHGKDGITKTVHRVLEPRLGQSVTAEDLHELTYELAQKPFETRAEQSRLTGEWLIYAHFEDQNYYLTIGSHSHGDEAIARNIKTVCCMEFPWLDSVLDSSG